METPAYNMDWGTTLDDGIIENSENDKNFVPSLRDIFQKHFSKQAAGTRQRPKYTIRVEVFMLQQSARAE